MCTYLQFDGMKSDIILFISNDKSDRKSYILNGIFYPTFIISVFIMWLMTLYVVLIKDKAPKKTMTAILKLLIILNIVTRNIKNEVIKDKKPTEEHEQVMPGS